MCHVDIKYTDKKKSGSEILYFDVYFTYNVFVCFGIKRISKSDGLRFWE